MHANITTGMAVARRIICQIQVTGEHTQPQVAPYLGIVF